MVAVHANIISNTKEHNADGEMSAVSARKLARNDRKMLYGEDEGTVLHSNGQQDTRCIPARGVHLYEDAHHEEGERHTHNQEPVS